MCKSHLPPAYMQDCLLAEAEAVLYGARPTCALPYPLLTELAMPSVLPVRAGDAFIIDNNRVRRLITSNMTVTTVAGKSTCSQLMYRSGQVCKHPRQAPAYTPQHQDPTLTCQA